MGGCRCHFRDCHVYSTKFPYIHFFHFPIKEAERFRKWRQYSQMDKMLEFSVVRRRNTRICARHFRAECFMNYKMNRLSPTAVPTIMRLSDDKALDFELDLESGVLIDLEKPKQKHLLPPDGFECPFFLKNDKILKEKLNELQNKQYSENEHMKFKQSECDKFIEIPPKTSTNTVEILEAVQIVAPSLKRSNQDRSEEETVSGKKCRILNNSNFTGGRDVKEISTVVLAPIANEDESENIQLVESIQIDTANEFISADGQFFLTSESFINNGCDEDIEFFHVHENDLHNNSTLSGSEETTVQLKTHSNATELDNVEIINIENRLLEFDKIKEDFDALYVKYSALKNENKELKMNCQLADEIKKQLQIENNNLKKSLKDFDSARENLQKYSEENQKLKNETINTKTLEIELMSKKEEIKELKKLLQTSRNIDAERENFELGIKHKEIDVLRKKLEQLQQQLNDTAGELKEVQNNLNNEENKNKMLIIQENKLKITLEETQNNFDLKQIAYNELKSNYEEILQKQSILEHKYWKLQAMQSQEASVSTSLENDRANTVPVVAPAPSISSTSLTKAQLFNGIKRYLCSSMVSLLRMEMFGNTEREWKSDERQVAVDILRLGETVYEYFTDEWRIRLPSLRIAREWLNQSHQLMSDEEDL